MNTSEKTKEKKEPKTLDNVEAEALTESEKAKLSRETVLKWYKASRLEKLKALQDEIVGAAESEKEALKVKIIENTKRELESHRELTEAEKEKQANNFADNLIKLKESNQTIEDIARIHNEEILAQNVFFKTLKEYTGKANNARFLKRITENPIIKKTLIAIKQLNPNVSQEIEVKMREGDYEGMKGLIVKGSEGKLDKKKVDKMFGIASFEKIGEKELTGIKTIDGILQTLGAYKYLGHTYSLNQASEDIGVPYQLILRTSVMTVKDLRAMDENLQRFKYLIDTKENKNLHDIKQINFIEAINKMRKRTDEKLAEEGLEYSFQQILEKYLDQKVQEKKLDAARAMEIKARAKMEDLRLIQIYELTYGKGENRERELFRLFSRIPTIIRAYQNYNKEGRELKEALYEYNKKRFIDHDAWTFKRKAKTWGLEKIMGDMNKLEGAIEGKRGKVGALFKEAEGFKMSDDLTKVTSEEMYKHDLIVKKYKYLVEQTSGLMTEKAKNLLGIGKQLEGYQRLIAADPNCKIGSTLLSEETKRALFPDIKDISKINAKPAKELLTAYGERLVELRTMHDVTRARFAALAETIEHKVAKPFGEKFEAKLDVIKGNKEKIQVQQGIQDIKETLSPTGKAKRVLTYGALPTFLIGMEIHGLTTGKVKPREVPWDIAEAGAGFIPVVGTALDFRAAISGTSLSGKTLGYKERVVAGAFGVVGAIADIGTILGGTGLYLRGALGTVRSARRAVSVGREAKSLAAAAHAGETAEKASVLHRLGMGIASKMDKTKDFENALLAGVRARAQEQSHYMAKCGLREWDDLSSVQTAIKQADAIKDADKIADLKKLERIMLETNGGVGYIKIFNDTNLGKITVPHSWFSRTKFGTVLREMALPPRSDVFIQMRKLNFTDDEIEQFIRNFDRMRELQISREATVQNLAKLTAVKEDKIAALKISKEELAQGASKGQQEFMQLLEKERKLFGDKFAIAQQAEKLKDKYKDNKTFMEILDKAEKGEKIDTRKIVQHVAYVPHGIPGAKGVKVKVKPSEVYEKNEVEILVKLSKSNKELNALNSEKKTIQAGLEKTNKEWVEKVNKNHDELKAVEGEFEAANAGLRNINSELSNVNQAYLRFESEMATRGEALARWSENTRTAAKYLQWGGIAVGSIWFLTGKNPIEQGGAVYDVAATGGKYAGKALHETFVADHSGSPALDVMIEEQADGLVRKQKYKDMLDMAKESGETQDSVAAMHINNPEMEEILKERGMLEKVKQRIKNGELSTNETAQEGASKIEFTTSDSAKKLREKI